MDLIPTVYNDFNKIIYIKDYKINLNIWDSGGQEDYDRLRPFSYPGTNLFIIAFSVDGRESFLNVEKKWINGKKIKIKKY